MFNARKNNVSAVNGEAGTGTAVAAVDKKESKVSQDRLSQFYDLKTRIHRKLVEQLDLTSLSNDSQELREEVRQVVTELAEEENAILNFGERQRLISEVLDETFGFGPLEVLLADPTTSAILVQGAPEHSRVGGAYP